LIRGLLVRLALVSASSAAAIVLAEVALRFTAHRLVGEGEWLEVGTVFRHDDPPMGFSLEPNSTRLSVKGGAYVIRDRINAQGMRDVEHRLEKPEGVKRVLVLGDSFMYGDGVEQEESMPRRLAAMTPQVAVINAGVRAWNLDQEYLYYKARGRRYGADLVILAFFINDLIRDPSYVARDGSGGLPEAYERTPEALKLQRDEAPRGWKGAVSSWLRSRSLLYKLVRSRLRSLGSADRPTPAAESPRRRPEIPYLPIFHAGTPGSAEPHWERAWRVMDALRELVAEDGAKLVVLIVPAPWQSSERDWEGWVDWLQADPLTLSRTRPQEMILDWCGRSGVMCLDLLPGLARRGGSRLYYAHDFHWTPEGHEAAAEETRGFLAAHGLP